MARTAMTELQQQIEAVRREAFAAGYAAAMEAIRELTSRAAPGTRTAAATPTRRGGGRGRTGGEGEGNANASASYPHDPRHYRYCEDAASGGSPSGRPPAAARHQCAHDRGDPEGGGAARRAPGGDPQSAAGQRRRDGVHLDPSRARSIGKEQCGRAGRRQQDLASSRRLILNRRRLRGDRAACQRVGAFVFRVAGMAADPVPLDLVRRRGGFQPLP